MNSYIFQRYLRISECNKLVFEHSPLVSCSKGLTIIPPATPNQTLSIGVGNEYTTISSKQVTSLHINIKKKLLYINKTRTVDKYN